MLGRIMDVEYLHPPHIQYKVCTFYAGFIYRVNAEHAEWPKEAFWHGIMLKWLAQWQSPAK
jgi:hypothetical protein